MKPRIGFYWCASCGGCEECFLDLAEEILPVLEAVDIVFWPVAVDFKTKDVTAMPDRAIDVYFINGAVRTTEQRHMALLLRAKARMVVAFGACAQLGGVPGLANLSNSEELLRAAYDGGIPRESAQVNGYTLELPRLFDTVLPLDRVIPVDYYLPGCPPTPNIIQDALRAILSGSLPPRGSVLAPDQALCEQCPRKDTRPTDLLLEAFHRVHEKTLDQNTCLLAQGVACLGPATRAGCEARCVNGNMPCTGCFGPSSRVRDFGAKALSAAASVVAATENDNIDRALEGLADPVGTFYRYSLPASFLQRKDKERIP
jgi:F420-non-reducing hydrogenase small subunit